MGEFLKKFFISGYGAPSESDYGVIYFIWIGIIAASMIVLPLVFRKTSERGRRRFYLILSFTAFGVYVVRHLIGRISSGDFGYMWPFYVCNIVTLAMPFAILFNVKYLSDFVFTMGLLGGLMTFALPGGLFPEIYLSYGMLDSMLSHYSIFIIPFVMMTAGGYRMKFSGIFSVYGGLFLCLVNYLLFADLIYPGDYLFFKGSDPFSIPGVPQWLIIVILALILVPLFWAVTNIGVIIKKSKKPKEKICPEDVKSVS